VLSERNGIDRWWDRLKKRKRRKKKREISKVASTENFVLRGSCGMGEKNKKKTKKKTKTGSVRFFAAVVHSSVAKLLPDHR
jgi:hypothetical protein